MLWHTPAVQAQGQFAARRAAQGRALLRLAALLASSQSRFALDGGKKLKAGKVISLGIQCDICLLLWRMLQTFTTPKQESGLLKLYYLHILQYGDFVETPVSKEHLETKYGKT